MFIIFLILFLVFTKPVYATSTDYFFPSTGTTNGSSYSSQETDDTSYNHWDDGDGANTIYTQVSGSSLNSFSVPDNAVINTISIKPLWMTTPAGGWSWYLRLYYGASYYGCASPINSWTTFHEHEKICAVPTDFSGLSSLTWGQLKNDDYNIRFEGSDYDATDINRFLLKIDYTIPDFSITTGTFVASSSSGLILGDLSGDFATHSANMKCDLDIFSDCTKSGYARDKSSVPVARVSFDGSDPQSTTSGITKGLYKGHSDLSVSSLWYAEGIELPYNQGWSCSYPIAYMCYHKDCTSYLLNGVTKYTCGDTIIDKQGQGLTNYSGNYNSSFVSSPSASVNTDTVYEGDCSGDWICSIKKWINQQMVYWFIPKSDLNTQFVTLIKDDLYTRIPFAYIAPVFSLDLTDPTISTTAPSLSFTFPIINYTYNWTSDGTVETYIGYFRNTATIFLWLGLITYLIFLARRII